MAGENYSSYYYPACRFILILLLVCIKTDNYKMLHKIFEQKFSKRNQNLFMYDSQPISIYLYTIHLNYTEGLFEIIKDYVPDEKHFWVLYDKAICFWSMFYWDKTGERPIKISFHSLYDDCRQIFENELMQLEESSILQSGFFQGSPDRFNECIQQVTTRRF